jgi:ELWxxDGT repeat protein
MFANITKLFARPLRARRNVTTASLQFESKILLSSLVSYVLNDESHALPEFFTSVGNDVYFAAKSPEYGKELFRLDSAGQITVFDIRAGLSNSSPNSLFEFNGELYFSAQNDIRELLHRVRSDGTVEVVESLVYLDGNWDPRDFTVFNDRLYFRAGHLGGIGGGGSGESTLTGRELWFINDSGYAEIAADLGGFFGSDPREFTIIGNEMYFVAETSGHGMEIWKVAPTSLTPHLASLVVETRPGVEDGEPRNLIAHAGNLYYVAYYPEYGHGVWRYQPGGSVHRVMNLPSYRISDFVKTDTELFFTVHSTDIYRIDEQHQASLHTDFQYSVSDLTAVGDKLYFYASNQLWGIDHGQVATLVGDHRSARGFIEHLGQLYFFATNSSNQQVVYRFDGITTPVSLFSGVYPRIGANSKYFTFIRERMFFMAKGPNVKYYDLWTFSESDQLGQHPTNLTLSSASLPENLPPATPVGSFSTTDPDTAETHTYTLVSGTGSTDNSSFTIVGNQLRTTASFDFEAKSSYTIRVRTTDQSGLFFEKTFIISVTDVVELPPGSTPLTNLRSGIAANDAATGTGYILYSQQNVKQRFTGLLPQNADHFLAVQFNNGQWQFANNDTWVNFTPTATDVLIAEVNFTADTLTMLRGNFGTISGIFKGFVDSNLVITPNVYNGVSNAGEFRLQGTYITFAPRTSLTGLRNGVGGTDNATGTGYMMYSQSNVRTRFSGLDSNNADNFINVRLNGSQWQYDNNSTWVNFTPTSTDILVAALDFTADTVTMLEGNIGLVNGIVQGYLDGDLAIIANNWAGTANAGEYRVTGTFITFAPRTPLTGLRNGVGGTDNATGTGYMMYSQQNVRTRFSGLDPNNADNFINVRLNGSQWQYDSNSTWVNFTPTSTDVLVAALNFTTDTVTLLEGNIGLVNGIVQGYLDGDLNIIANNWNGTANTGEYHLTGTFITFSHVTSSSPLNLSLSTTTIAENQPSGTPVGSFSTIDPDTNNTFTYSLVAGTGSADNPSFTIVGNQLRTAASFNYESRSSYTIRVRTTDQGGLFFEKTFIISVTDVFELPPGATPLTNLRNGVGGTDNATGTGYMMYSQQNVRTRFSGLDPNNADNFINVRLNGSQWQLDNNTTWVNFTPTSTDVLVAALNFTTDTVTLLEGNIGLVNGIVQGYLDGDLAIIANNWAGTSNAGEYRVTGTYLTFAPRTPLTGLRNGVGGTDNATGTGYMMYSQSNVRTRFSGLDPNNADNFINVRYFAGQWQYDSNSTWVNFTPTSSDRLVATLDFTADTVDLLKGTFSTIQGIASGYLDGDLAITPNNWNGFTNTGEFHLTGTYITFMPTV